jgi:hypothetical protein
MNYQKIHDQIISRGKTRVLFGYKERHHIIPRCMGGTDNLENLVDLTAREHFIVHRLLCEIYPNNDKLQYAQWMMSNVKYEYRTYNISNREYERIRQLIRDKLSKRMSGENNPMFGRSLIPYNKGIYGVYKMSVETKKKMSDAQKNRKRKPFSDEAKQKMSIARKGYTYSDEEKQKRSGWNHSDEAKQKMSIAKIGYKHSDESKQKMKKPKRILQCPHCNKQGGEPQMYQWHFNNCKYA